MNPEDDLHNYEDHRNLRDKILAQYGKETMKKVRRFERYILHLAKKKTSITFLKRCRDSLVIPKYLLAMHLLHLFIKLNNKTSFPLILSHPEMHPYPPRNQISLGTLRSTISTQKPYFNTPMPPP